MEHNGIERERESVCCVYVYAYMFTAATCVNIDFPMCTHTIAVTPIGVYT